MTQKFSIKGFADNSITGDKIAGFTSATDGFVITKSSGSLTWAAAADPNPTMGGDLTGLASNAQIAANAVGVTELNVTIGTAGQALTIDGGGTLGFTTIVTDPTMGGDLTGTASNAQIAANSVGTTELADNSVTSDKIGIDVIVAEDIAANAITVAELQDGAVTAAKIATGAITSGKIHNSVSMGGPSQGIGSIIRTNSNAINEDLTLASDTNGVTMGPVTVLLNNTVTVNGQWKVI
jgi:hypothetical protein